MSNYVREAKIDLLSGTLKGTISFLEGLNLICGENGTLKTHLLRALKGGGGSTWSQPGTPARIYAISPKRNAERRAIETIVQTMRQQNRNFDSYISETGGLPMDDATFARYASLGDLYYFVFERKARDGGEQRSHMKAVADEFNAVIQQVFPQYAIVAEWNATMGSPTLKVQKHSGILVPIENLSLGEQEVLSLVLNLFASRDSYDLFLIDEPEVHLNWHLEERLFVYLDRFCREFQKQIIAVTHSRVVFKEDFLPKTQFLAWRDDHTIEWAKAPSAELRSKIAGDAMAVIRLGDFSGRTAFVEDRAHELVISGIARVLRQTISIVRCGSRENVRSLFKRSRLDGGWPKTLFVEDGDNEGTPFQGAESFVHLDKYAIQNYLLDPGIMASATGKTEADCRILVHASVLAMRNRVLGKHKVLGFLLDKLTPADMTVDLLAKLDASDILPELLRSLGETDDSRTPDIAP